jgi:hypothetical protein
LRIECREFGGLHGKYVMRRQLPSASSQECQALFSG